jgi:hypothetical protein
LLESQTISSTWETSRWLSDGGNCSEEAMTGCEDQSLGSVWAGKKPSSGVCSRTGSHDIGEGAGQKGGWLRYEVGDLRDRTWPLAKRERRR